MIRTPSGRITLEVGDIITCDKIIVGTMFDSTTDFFAARELVEGGKAEYVRVKATHTHTRSGAQGHRPQ